MAPRAAGVDEKEATVLGVFSIFNSIDGEVNAHYQGRLTTFLRLAGCNLNCTYCDTQMAREVTTGKMRNTEKVFDELMSHAPYKVTITGGEPLLQAIEVAALCKLLYAAGVHVSIETNGAVEIPFHLFTTPVNWVVDYKLGSSEMYKEMHWESFAQLGIGDFVKFVIADRADFDQAIMVMRTIPSIGDDPTFAFSPCHGTLSPATLIEWLYAAGITDAVVNLQLHKIIGLNEDK